MMTDHVEDGDDEHDEYDELLTALGRSYDEDVRISLHESGHCIAQLLFGEPVGFVTVNPADGYEGCVRGEWGIRGFVKEGGKVLDAGDVRAVLAPCMPLPGEDRAKVSDIFSTVHAKCIQYASGKVAERMLLDGEPSFASDDIRQARELAALICSSEKAIDSFLDHCEIAAHDLLAPYVPLLMSLQIILRLRRTMTGAEVYDVIATTLARFELAAERARRRQWKGTLASAAAFRRNDRDRRNARAPAGLTCKSVELLEKFAHAGTART